MRINIVDEVLNIGATDNKVKYRIIHEDGTNEIVQIQLETPVTTEGTPYNRALMKQVDDLVVEQSDIHSFTSTQVSYNNPRYLHRNIYVHNQWQKIF